MERPVKKRHFWMILWMFLCWRFTNLKIEDWKSRNKLASPKRHETTSFGSCLGCHWRSPRSSIGNKAGKEGKLPWTKGTSTDEVFFCWSFLKVGKVGRYEGIKKMRNQSIIIFFDETYGEKMAETLRFLHLRLPMVSRRLLRYPVVAARTKRDSALRCL